MMRGRLRRRSSPVAPAAPAQGAGADRDRIHQLVASVPHWYHRIEVAPGIVTPGVNDSTLMLQSLPLPESCAGLRVLDLGARDGFFSFEMERRGAEVLAIDYMPVEETGFSVAKQLLGSHVEYVTANVYDLSRERFGVFDLVLFLGLLYHLRDPLLALDRIRDVCTDRLVVETQVIDDALLLPDGSMTTLQDVDPRLSQLPLMQFYPREELNGDFTNWWAPNTRCLQELISAAGFRVDHMVSNAARAVALAVVADDEQTRYQRAIEKASNVSDLSAQRSEGA